MFDEGGLHRVQRGGRAQAFNGGDLGPVMHDGQRQTGIDAPPVQHHRTGATLAVVATLLGAGQVQMFAQRVQQRGAHVQGHLARRAIDTQGHSGGHGLHAGLRGLLGDRHRWRGHRGGRDGACLEQVAPGDLDGKRIFQGSLFV
ncbi:hypothetical protein D3C73_1297090 [compost metagenome]